MAPRLSRTRMIPMRLRLLRCTAALALVGPTASSAVEVSLGPQQAVLSDGQLGLRYFPDGHLAVLQEGGRTKVFLAAGVRSYRLEGRSLTDLTSVREVLAPGQPGAFDNGYAGINALWREPSGRLLAFYHAEDQEGMAHTVSQVPGFYCSVAAAASTDGGNTFEKLGPILTGHLPKNPAGTPDQGCGEPCVQEDPGGKYLLVYYTSHERAGNRGVQVCLARCPIAEVAQPASWRKYHEGAFDEPGLGGRDTPVLASPFSAADAVFLHVQYVTAWHRFVMVFCVNAWQEQGAPERSGFYVALSGDGLAWPREHLRQFLPSFTVPSLGRELSWHPTLVLDDKPGDGSHPAGWLDYGYSKSWGSELPNTPHYLVRRAIKLGR